ncbi:nucleoside triphosphate pyrophosphohydrolase [Bacteriovorax sp. PP10]|uniref:Nucleoside triphosphate pyrophosphohydrolase n=1 Tax=Bacteriovorax antarcticus TaxID=3088717 RepID=A0ABU5VST3_9BACT|nr:nucleoside triphosphate pyrophosphohydrolase [Bacteriovorax sp. PP10]MEA9355448.1 nucleoside triphosphate pyrophosphohydrolase [Bacteriovorax sp. PP10]
MNKSNFEKLKDVIAALRDPVDGCPWDLKQTHESLLKYLLEESYEFVEAVEEKDPKKMEEEIGDVLMQVLLHAQLASEKNQFDIESVSKVLTEKLVRRHPHVFENKNTAITADQVVLNWEKIKAEEKLREAGEATHHRIKKSVLNAPSLLAATKIGKKTNDLKFDWDDYTQVAYKVEEEWQELKEELTPHRPINRDAVFEEMGDLLFSIAQLARHLDMDADAALHAANKKFLRRFHSMEDLMEKSGKRLESMNQEQMDVYWNQAKVHEKASK